jgi:hypothetical protein
MRGLLLMGPLLFLAGFSPPDRPQGIQEGPPRSWIPEKAEKPPITMTPELPKLPALPPSGGAADGSAVPIPRVDLQACATRERASAKPTEDFVDAYNAAKTAFAARRHDEAFALAFEAEGLSNARQQRTAVLMMQVLIAASIGDAEMLEKVIARRVELGCVSTSDWKSFEQARERIKSRK